MINVTIDTSDCLKKLDSLVRYIKDDISFIPVEGIIGEIAEKCVLDMKNTISNERKNPKRPDDALVNNIDMEDISPSRTHLMIGIGNIARLKLLAPHFELINDGGTYVTKETHAVPTTYMGYEREGFVTLREGSSHTITGIDYVGRAMRNLEKNLDKGLQDIGVEILKGLENASSGITPSGFSTSKKEWWGSSIKWGPKGSGGFSGSSR